MPDFRRIFGAFNEYEQFVCTMSTMSLTFSLFPEWAQNVAFAKYQEEAARVMDMMETGQDEEHFLTPSEVIRVIWSDGERKDYLKTAESAMKVAKDLKEHLDQFQHPKDMVQFFEGQFFPHWDMEAEENLLFFSMDIAGEIPVMLVKFDEQEQITYIDIYGNPIDLHTGEVHTLEQLSRKQVEAEKEDRAQKEKNYKRPTGKQLRMARALCEKHGLEMPYFTTRDAIGRFIWKLNQGKDQSPKTPPRIAEQLRTAQAAAQQERPKPEANRSTEKEH